MNREPGQRIRTISRSTSKDFVHWTNPVEMGFGGTLLEHLYTNAITPYYRAKHLLVALPGRRLVINVSTSAAGGIAVELRDANGRVLPGYEADACDLVVGDEIPRTVTWKGSGNLERLAGTPVRLRFVLKDADLFSIQFQP